MAMYKELRSLQALEACLPELRLDGGLKVSTAQRSTALASRP